MNFRRILAACAIALTTFGVSAANAASSLKIDYFEITNPGFNHSYPYPTTDFGICCSSGPATTEGNLNGTSLLGGLPVAGGGNNIVMLSNLGQILWWTPGAVDPATGYAIASTGSNIVNFASTYSSPMYAPSSSGTTNTGLYQTAILSGYVSHTGGGAALLNLDADDDALVYLNGSYIGGFPGVHHNLGSPAISIALPNFTGSQKLEVFYADRALVEANITLNFVNATISAVPEPGTWAMMLLGLFGTGAMMRIARRKAVAIA